MPVKQDEKGAVSEWRYDVCLQLGIAPDDAALLAERHDLDLHTIIELVQVKGCPPAQAPRILL